MKNIRITNGFKKLSPADLLTRASFIKNSISNNPHFPSPTPSIDQLEESITIFSEATVKAETGDKQQIAVRNQAKELLIQQLHRLANFVLFAADNDEVAASSSGLTISKTPSASEIGLPKELKLKNGINKGELELSFRRVAGVKAYMYQVTESPVTADSKWHSDLSTISRNLFSGLKSGAEYSCRVAAIGANRQVVFSEVVSRIAL